MSDDMNKKTLIGVRLTPPIIEKLDERAKIYGGNRQDQITDLLKKALIESC